MNPETSIYIIHELRNLDNVCPGDTYVGTLHGAKAKATREQAWKDTTLKITDTDGRAVAVKDKQTGKWFDPRV